MSAPKAPADRGPDPLGTSLHAVTTDRSVEGWLQGIRPCMGEARALPLGPDSSHPLTRISHMVRCPSRA